MTEMALYDVNRQPVTLALKDLQASLLAKKLQAVSNAIEAPRRRESWVARDLRVVMDAVRRVFGGLR